MQNYKERFDIIYKKFCKIAEASGVENPKTSRLAMARYLGISQGKMQAWQRGQPPSTKDIAILHEKLGLSMPWLMYNEGPPDIEEAQHLPKRTARNAKGQLVGDLLRDIMLAELRITAEDFAASIATTATAMQELLDSCRHPTWEELAAMHKNHGINAGFLLTGEGEDILPKNELERAAKAAGKPLDVYFIADVFKCSYQEAGEILEKHISLKIKRQRELVNNHGQSDTLPSCLDREQTDILRAEYGMTPAWLFSGTGQSHERRTDVERTTPNTPKERPVFNMSKLIK